MLLCAETNESCRPFKGLTRDTLPTDRTVPRTASRCSTAHRIPSRVFERGYSPLRTPSSLACRLADLCRKLEQRLAWACERGPPRCKCCCAVAFEGGAGRGRWLRWAASAHVRCTRTLWPVAAKSLPAAVASLLLFRLTPPALPEPAGTAPSRKTAALRLGLCHTLRQGSGETLLGCRSRLAASSLLLPSATPPLF